MSIKQWIQDGVKSWISKHDEGSYPQDCFMLEQDKPLFTVEKSLQNKCFIETQVDNFWLLENISCLEWNCTDNVCNKIWWTASTPYEPPVRRPRYYLGISKLENFPFHTIKMAGSLKFQSSGVQIINQPRSELKDFSSILKQLRMMEYRCFHLHISSTIPDEVVARFIYYIKCHTVKWYGRNCSSQTIKVAIRKKIPMTLKIDASFDYFNYVAHLPRATLIMDTVNYELLVPRFNKFLENVLAERINPAVSLLEVICENKVSFHCEVDSLLFLGFHPVISPDPQLNQYLFRQNEHYRRMAIPHVFYAVTSNHEILLFRVIHFQRMWATAVGFYPRGNRKNMMIHLQQFIFQRSVIDWSAASPFLNAFNHEIPFQLRCLVEKNNHSNAYQKTLLSHSIQTSPSPHAVDRFRKYWPFA